MEKQQLSTDARRLIAHRINSGETASRVAYDFAITESEAQRVAVSYYGSN
ncbi:hypothetical protein G9444_0786 [Rhodococcus erythropolis]|uniref:Transposase n=1 Tax=Rhodococcus erythropolis TaxID=1833 RepID=A0A6G9CMJ5_RHOER|nr:hypothetical protein [Rhodococcus erythropolis]QIP38030.1 hypothetical protein G9444_0786 [Rhodococcus erythropolis]